MKIKQLNANEVLDFICKGYSVYRFDKDKSETRNLVSTSVKRIVDGFNKDSYIYFILEESE